MCGLSECWFLLLRLKEDPAESESSTLAGASVGDKEIQEKFPPFFTSG